MKMRRFVMKTGSSWGMIRPGRTTTKKLKQVRKNVRRIGWIPTSQKRDIEGLSSYALIEGRATPPRGTRLDAR